MNLSAHIKVASLQEAISAALSGDKQVAHALLEQITTTHPEHELAWLWLASVSVTPLETIQCWRRVYKINPHQEQALAGLKRLLLQEGVNAARNDRKEEARELLLELTQLDRQHEVAWLWLATLAKPDGWLEVDSYAGKRGFVRANAVALGGPPRGARGCGTRGCRRRKVPHLAHLHGRVGARVRPRLAVAMAGVGRQAAGRWM